MNLLNSHEPLFEGVRSDSTAPFITRGHTTCLYGVAILLMVFHHTLGCGIFDFEFGFPDMMGYDVLAIVAHEVGKQCVAIYAFMGGFGLALLSCKIVWARLAEAQGPRELVKKFASLVWSRYRKFYPRYWFVFALFVPIGMLLGARAYDGGALEFLLNLVGLSSTYCPTWWYVKQYVFMVLVFPLVDALLHLLRVDGLGGGCPHPRFTRVVPGDGMGVVQARPYPVCLHVHLRCWCGVRAGFAVRAIQGPLAGCVHMEAGNCGSACGLGTAGCRAALPSSGRACGHRARRSARVVTRCAHGRFEGAVHAVAGAFRKAFNHDVAHA